MDPETPKKAGNGESRAKEQKSSSKKRRHEEQSQANAGGATNHGEDNAEHRKKKRQRSDKHGAADTAAAGIKVEPDVEVEKSASQTANGNSKELAKASKKRDEAHRRERDRVAALQKSQKSQGQTDDSNEQVDSQATTVGDDDEVDAAATGSQSKTTVAAALLSKMPHSATPNSSIPIEDTPFVRTTTSLLVPLACPALDSPVQGLCAEHLSPLLLTYYPPLKGILISYDKPRIHADSNRIPSYVAPPSDGIVEEAREAWSAQPTMLASTVNEYSTPFIWLTAEFTLLRPRRGVRMVGTVCVQNPSWLGLVCWNWFSAGIPANRLPTGWRWIDFVGENGAGRAKKEPAETVIGEEAGEEAPAEHDEDEDLLAGEGCWVDEKGVPVRSAVEFALRDFEHQASTERESGFVSFEGTLLSAEEDAKVDKSIRDEAKELRRASKGKNRSRRRQDDDAMEF